MTVVKSYIQPHYRNILVFAKVLFSDRGCGEAIRAYWERIFAAHSTRTSMLHRDPMGFGPSADSTLAGVSSVLGTDSTLRELPLHAAKLDLTSLGQAAVELFNAAPELPGILLTDHNITIGILSRYRFLDYLVRPKGWSLFSAEPLSVLYSYARQKPLIFAAETPILVAARAALRRPPELQGEPIWVQGSEGDRILSAYELNVAHWQIRGIETQIRYERAQAAMLQNQKMAALGRLVDGVSHEILDPLGFIWGNLSHVSRYCQQLLELVAAYERTMPEATRCQTLIDLKDDIELDYLQEDLPNTLSSIQSGAERLKQLATSLQNFCHIDEVYPKPADIHDLLDSIVLLLKSRLTTKIHVVRTYTSLPPVPCFAGQLSQVFMNALSHCVDTLLSQAARNQVAADLELTTSAADVVSPTTPQIRISTQLLTGVEVGGAVSDRWVSIAIADNGPGLSAAEQQRIYDSFLVQQRLERETDLAACYRIVTAKHGGKFEVQSGAIARSSNAAQGGTKFTIQLPLYTRSGPF